MIADVQQHERDVSHTIHENVPEHEPRGEYDDDFYESERKAVLEEADGCWICGRTEDDLKNDDGYGEYLEAHHWAVEWSLWNAVDTDRIQSLLDSAVIDWYGFCEEKKGEPIEHPGDRRNLVVLCPRHHRYAPDSGKGFGVHNGPWPLWMAQKAKRSEYTLIDPE